MTPFPRRLSFRTFTPQEIASHIKHSYFSSERGWFSLFGDSWGNAHDKVELLPENASVGEIFRAIGGTLSPHLPFLHCASCTTFSTSFCNLGRTQATFWVCERCVDEAKEIFQKGHSL